MQPPKLSHIAIACPELETVAKKLSVLSLKVSERHNVPSEKVDVAMLAMEVSSHLRLELLQPTDPESPIAKFLAKKPGGGLHHICFEVSGLEEWKKVLDAEGLEVLPPGIRMAARGRALFIHPKSMGGVLVELEEMAKGI